MPLHSRPASVVPLSRLTHPFRTTPKTSSKNIATSQNPLRTPTPSFAYQHLNSPKFQKLARDLTTPPTGRWTLTEDGKGLDRHFEFETFKKAFSFMKAVAITAKTRQHHPTWSNVYNKVFIRWTTHAPAGLTEKDLAMAQVCDQLVTRTEYQERPGRKSKQGTVVEGQGLLTGVLDVVLGGRKRRRDGGQEALKQGGGADEDEDGTFLESGGQEQSVKLGENDKQQQGESQEQRRSQEESRKQEEKKKQAEKEKIEEEERAEGGQGSLAGIGGQPT